MTATNPKRKRVSKRNKVAWRKHTKVADIEEFLEDQRLEERLGPPLSTVSNDKLFQIDVNVVKTESPNRKSKAQRPLKCFQVLEPHTNVPDPIKKRNHVKTKEERQSVFIKSKLSNPKAAKQGNTLKQLKKSPKVENFDVWGDESKHPIENEEWADNDTKRHTLTGLGKLRKTTKAPTDRSKLPAVEPPHPGMSYNPSYKDHQDLLQEIAKREAEILKEEKHLNRVTSQMFIKMTPKQFEEWWLREMSEGLPNEKKEEKEEEEQEEDEETDDECKSINPPVKNSKKTLKQRRKQKEQQQLQFQKQQEKREKKKVTDIHQLRLVKKQLDKLDKRIALLREKRAKARQFMEKKPKRLGQIKFEEPELEFQMGHEISGNLRNIKKEGNLLKDRFKSLQKRNIIEPTIKRVRKKVKVKKYTKPGHKDDWKKTVAGIAK